MREQERTEITRLQNQVSKLVPPPSSYYASQRVGEICKGKDPKHIDVLYAIINDTAFDKRQRLDALRRDLFPLLANAHALAKNSNRIDFSPSTMTQIIQRKHSLQAAFNSPIQPFQEKSLELCYALAQVTGDASYLTQPIIDLWSGYFSELRDVKFKALVQLFQRNYPVFIFSLHACLTASERFTEAELTEAIQSDSIEGYFNAEIRNRISAQYLLSDIEHTDDRYGYFNNFFAPGYVNLRMDYTQQHSPTEESDEESVEESDEELDVTIQPNPCLTQHNTRVQNVQPPNLTENVSQDYSNNSDKAVTPSNTIGMIVGVAAGMLMLSLPFWLPTLIMVSATVLTLLDVAAAVGVVITGACAYQLRMTSGTP